MAKKKSEDRIDDAAIGDFNPLKMVEDSINSGFDPSIAQEIDEREINWCPNIWSWIVDPAYLDVKTIYPTQIQVLLRLFGDVCPWCSDFEYYITDFNVLETLGNIRDKITLLEFGKCPTCGKTRLDQYHAGLWDFPNELDLCWGMRCVSLSSLVFTERGLVQLKDVQVGDTLTHGTATKKFDSGKLTSLRLTTDMNWTLSGSKESHIAPILNINLELEHKNIKDCKVGDYLVLHSPNLWPADVYKLPEFTREKLAHGHQAKDFIFPTEVTPEWARLVGYLISNGQYTKKYSLRFISSDPATDEDIKRCCLAVFGEEPRREEHRECETKPFCRTWSLNGVAIMDWLKFIGLEPNTAKDKRIPDFILQSPKHIVCEFLAGLFGGDGGIYVETVGERKKVLLYYTSASETLTEQVRLLLLNMGIITNLSKFISNGYSKANTYLKDVNTSGDDNYSYRLATKCSKFIQIFKDNVRLVAQDKLDALTYLSTKGRIRYATPQGLFQLGTAKCPEKITRLAEQGYFFVKIKDIQDGEIEHMMDVHIPETNVYTAGGFVHHNSGKSAIVGILSSYHLHRFLHIPDPASYFNLLKGSLLVMRFVALTAGQANESIWHQFTRSVETCAWFGQYHDFLKHHEKRMGVELVKWLNTQFTYTHKKVTGYYIGAAIDTSRGRTAFGSFFDEIGWWLGHDQAKRANAHETYQAYQKASRTIRNAANTKFLEGHYDVPTALMACVSSTSSKTDYMMHLIKLAKKDKKRVASHKASWEVNPEFAKNPDELKAERDNNLKAFLRDYGSVPPFSDSPFIDNEDQVFKLAKLEIPKWGVVTEVNDIGMYLDAEGVEKDPNIPYCLSIDLGHSKCGYAASLLKLKEDDFSTIQIAGLFAIYPHEGKVVDMASTFTYFVKRITELVPIRLIVYDQWQSKTQIQELQGAGVNATQYSMTFQDFSYFRNQLMQSKLEYPKTEIPIEDVDKSPDSHQEILYPRPYLHFMWQLLSVSEYGNKVGKGDGHDDLFRAVALGCRFLWDDDFRPDFEYRAGMQLSSRRLGKGRLAMAGGSKSGHMFGTTANIGMGSVTVGAPCKSGRAIGAVITRNKLQ